jgi:hypothetical protein
MNSRIETIKAATEPVRQRITGHTIYPEIQDMEDIRIFMQYHVYAVWDFMSLLKTLQNALTCTQVPWFPKGSAENRYLINEIVVSEESDTGPDGERHSHFELYLKAMKKCGADTSGIENFLAALRETGDLSTAFARAGTPPEAAAFVDFTFSIIASGKPHVQAAVFTFGREDLIPDMFLSLINRLHAHYPSEISDFRYYMERHVEVDGGHHSHLALKMTEGLCGSNEQNWREAEEAVQLSLQKRENLWDGVYRSLLAKKEGAMSL